MDASDVQLPFPTQGALLSLHIGRILQAAEYAQDKFKELIQAAAPWPSCSAPDAFKPMDRTTWLLSSLGGMTEKKKVEWFCDTIFSGFLIKLLEEGEARASHATAFAVCIQDAWEQEVETEVGDATAQCMETILRCVRCLMMLHTFDLDMMTSGAWEDLGYIMKRAAATGSGADVLFAITMLENDYWSGRVKKLGEARSGIQQHGAQLKQDTAFLKTLSPEADFATPELPKILQRLCLYTSEMPEEAIAKVLQLAKDKTKAVIKFALGCATSGKHEVLKPLLAIAHEASLAFSLDSEVDELISQIHSTSKQSAMHAILQKCVELSTAMREVGTADMDASPQMKAFIDYASECSMGQLPEEHVPHFVACLESCLAALPHLLTLDMEKEPTTLKACSIIASWMSQQAPMARKTQLWQKVWELQGAYHKYMQLGSTVQERMDADTGADDVQWPLLTSMRQLLHVLADPSITDASIGLDSSLKQWLQQATGQAKSVQEEVSKHALGIKHAIVTEKLNALEPLAGGMENGAHWMESLGDAASWDELLSHFKVTMGKNSHDTLAQARAALRQASIYTSGFTMRARRHAKFISMQCMWLQLEWHHLLWGLLHTSYVYLVCVACMCRKPYHSQACVIACMCVPAGLCYVCVRACALLYAYPHLMWHQVLCGLLHIVNRPSVFACVCRKRSYLQACAFACACMQEVVYLFTSLCVYLMCSPACAGNACLSA
jgi:hypothetical protein